MSEPQPEVEPSVPAGSDPASAPMSSPPAATSAPASGPPAAPAPALTSGAGSRPPAPKRRFSLASLLIFAVVGFILAAAATGLYFYDRATQPNRSTPTVTVQQFMGAVFLPNGTTNVEQFICDRWEPADAISWTTGLADPEARVSWDTVLTISETENEARVTARVRFRYRDDVAPSGEQQWRFDLVDENGWRVCNVGRVSA